MCERFVPLPSYLVSKVQLTKVLDCHTVEVTSSDFRIINFGYWLIAAFTNYQAHV